MNEFVLAELWNGSVHAIPIADRRWKAECEIWAKKNTDMKP